MLAPGQRSRRRDDLVLGAVVALVSVAVYVLHGHRGQLTRDLAIYTYAGQRFLEGDPPYVGILNRAGPLAHVLPGLAIGAGRVVGADDVVGARAGFLALAVATVCAVQLLASRALGSRAAGLVAAAAMLSFTGFTQYAADGPREKTPMVLLLVLCLLALHHRRWALAGLALGLATLTLQIAFPLGAAAFLVAWGWPTERGRRAPALARFAAGGAAAVALVAVPMALAGRTTELLDGFWRINARWTEPDPPLLHAGPVATNVVEGYAWSFPVLLAGLVAALVLGALALRARSAPGARTLAACAGGLVGFTAWSLREFDSWADVFPALPVAALGVAALVAVVAPRPRSPRTSEAPGSPGRGRAAALVARAGAGPRTAAAALVAAALVAGAATWSVTHRSTALDAQRAAAAAVVEPLPADATFFQVEAPQALVLERRESVSRLGTLSAGLDRYVEDTYPGGLAGLVADVAADGTDVVLVTADDPLPAWLVDGLAADYVEVPGTAPWWRTYLRRDLPAEVRAEVERRVAALDG